MEIEVEVKDFSIAAAVIALITLILLGVLGWLFTPPDNGVLTYAEWQLRKQEQAYRRELAGLQKTCEEMSALLEKPLQPLRVQVAADRILHRMEKGGLAVLQPQRDAAAAAAQSLHNWALGDSRDAAVSGVAEACRRVAEVSGGSLP